MKKIWIVVLAIVSFFTSSLMVKAACSATETSKLNQLAVNVKASYEEAEGILDKDSYVPPDGLTEEELKEYEEKYLYFKIYIANLTEDLYVVVTNDVNKEKNTYTYQDSKDGVITINWEDIWDITNFTITVYSSDKTGCPDTKLTTLYLTTPRYNRYYDYMACSENGDFYLCYKYLTIKNVDEDEFFRLLEQYQKGKINKDGENIVEEPAKEKGFVQFIKDNKVIVIIATIVVVAIGGTITVILVKKQRSKSV